MRQLYRRSSGGHIGHETRASVPSGDCIHNGHDDNGTGDAGIQVSGTLFRHVHLRLGHHNRDGDDRFIARICPGRQVGGQEPESRGSLQDHIRSRLLHVPDPLREAALEPWLSH